MLYSRTLLFIHPVYNLYLLTPNSEKATAPHSSILAWKIPWMEEPGGLQSMGSLRVGHNWATSLSLFTFMHWRRNGNPLQCSCLENPRDGGAWWAAVHRVAQSRTRLKRLSSSSSNPKLPLFHQIFKSYKIKNNNITSELTQELLFWYKKNW